MNIQDLMSKPAISCSPTDTLEVPARLMWSCDCGMIPVTNETGNLVGIVTDRDICMAAMMKGRPLHEITVGGTMARRVSSCKAGDSVEAVSRVMSDRQVRRVPVVDDENRPIGVVSLSDLARQATIAPRKDGTFRELAQTLAAISRRGPKATAKHPRQDAPNTAGHTLPTVVREDTPAS